MLHPIKPVKDFSHVREDQAAFARVDGFPADATLTNQCGRAAPFSASSVRRTGHAAHRLTAVSNTLPMTATFIDSPCRQ